MPVQTIAAAFQRAVEADAAKCAMQDEDVSISYGEAWQRASRIAASLDQLGVERGDPVLTLFDTHVDGIVTWLAMALGGTVEVPLNTALKGTFLEYNINDAGARTIIVDARYVDRIQAIAGSLPNLDTVIVRGAPAGAAEGIADRALSFDSLLETTDEHVATVDPWDVAAIMYTSGTTGPSKGVLCTHGQAVSYAWPEWWGVAERDDVAYLTLPPFHIGGKWMGSLNAVLAGATMALRQRFSASSFWDDVRDVEATWAMLIGAMGNILWQQPANERDRDHTLRRVFMAPVMDDWEGFQTRFGVLMTSGYGLTEGNGTMRSEFGAARPGSCGQLRPGFEARIVDAHDRELPDGQVGELLLRSDEPWQLSLGYHGRPEATVQAFRNGWLHTGDALYRDEDGVFHFVDRKKDVIRRRGENVSSFEVEGVVNGHPAVLESAAVGVPAELGEEEIKTVVVLKPGATLQPADLLEFLKDNMPYFMVPRYVEFVDALPRSASDKVKKTQLREAGVSDATWDRVKAGIHVSREA